METIRALIIRLQQQSDQQAVPSELLATVQQLQSALQQAMAEPVRPIRSGNISVVFPSGNRIHTPPPPPPVAEPEKVVAKEVVPEPVRVPEPVSAPEPARVPEPVRAAEPLRVPEPSRIFEPLPVPEPVQASVPMPAEPEAVSVADNFHLSFQKEDEAKKQPAPQQMEMNDIFGQSSSLNDRMRADQQEIGSVLKEEPVKDLRRAIGINDRFVYLSELFRGDEVMYERSLKTINNFRIYPEAEYWIERELKVKLGWDESKETVKQFRQLVRRRFQA